MTIETTFNGLGMSLGNLSLLSAAQTRSISAENFDESKGRGGMATRGQGAVSARELGQEWSEFSFFEAFVQLCLGQRGRKPGIADEAYGP